MPHLSPLITAPARLDDHVAAIANTLANTSAQALPQAPQLRSSIAHSPSTVALSFAFDSVEKTLNVVITDQRSGEILRKIEYNHIPHDVHQTEKLNGLLLNQFA